MKRIVSLALALALSLALLTGCGAQTPAATTGTTVPSSVPVASDTPTTNAAAADTAEKPDFPKVFEDSLGTKFSIDKPLEKVVVLNRQTAEAFKLLGIEKAVIAVGDTVHKNNSYLGFNDLPDMGKVGELNIEAILALEPDAVFVHTNRATELEDKLTPAGIPVIRIDNYQPEKYADELMLLASIFDVTDRAEEFLEYRSKVEGLVAERVAKLSEEQRPTVMALSVGFLNSQGGYRIFPCYSNDGTPGVGEGFSTILLGGKDASPEITYDKAAASTTILVEEEYALSCDPQVLTLHGTWLGGYQCTDEVDFQKVIDNIYEISSISKMKAGADKKVYVFHTDFLGASKRHIGLLQLGKYLYPDAFADIDVDEYAKEYFEGWLGTEYKGIWFYAAK